MPMTRLLARQQHMSDSNYLCYEADNGTTVKTRLKRDNGPNSYASDIQNTVASVVVVSPTKSHPSYTQRSLYAPQSIDKPIWFRFIITVQMMIYKQETHHCVPNSYLTQYPQLCSCTCSKFRFYPSLRLRLKFRPIHTLFTVHHGLGILVIDFTFSSSIEWCSLLH